jgi:hypothetical protein
MLQKVVLSLAAWVRRNMACIALEDFRHARSKYMANILKPRVAVAPKDFVFAQYTFDQILEREVVVQASSKVGSSGRPRSVTRPTCTNRTLTYR